MAQLYLVRVRYSDDSAVEPDPAMSLWQGAGWFEFRLDENVHLGSWACLSQPGKHTQMDAAS